MSTQLIVDDNNKYCTVTI